MHEARRGRPEDAGAKLQRPLDLGTAARKPNPWFQRGTVYRAALDVLRAAPRPMTAREIAEALLAAKGIADAPRRKISNPGARRPFLQNHKEGEVVAVGEGGPTRWKIT